MDRATAYPLEETTELDILNTNKFAMVGLGKLALAIIGTGPVLHGLPCTPGAGLTVQVGAGQIYLVEQTDPMAYSSLGVDTRNLVKQGLMLDAATLNCPAPSGAGQAINYLIEVGYQESDTGPVVLPFYNASNPAIAFSGPGGSGAPVSTVRSAQCLVRTKAGAAAAAGTQVTPAPDAGFIGAYVVTVAAGAAGIVAGNIAVAVGAPFLAGLLNSHHHGTAGQAPKIDLTSEVQGVLPLTNLPANIAVSTGTTTVGHIAVFSDTHGDIQDGGPIGAASAATYINASTTIGPGVYRVDTSAGPITLTLIGAPAQGSFIELDDALLTWGANNLTIVGNGNTIYGSASDFVCDVSGVGIPLLFKSGDWKIS